MMCQICALHRAADGTHAGHIGAARLEGMLATKAQAFSPGSSTVAALLESFSWSGTAGMAGSAAYSFGASVQGGALFGSGARAAALEIMQNFANVANITFNEVGSSAADLTFSQKNLGSGTLGLTTTLFSGSTIASSEVQLSDSYTSFGAGTDAYLTLLHEVGHAVGLKHPGNYSGSEDGPFLPASEDSNDASVMSYITGTFANSLTPPRSLMIYDIAAVQYLYGANTGYNTGDTVYSYDGSARALAVWDGGGAADMISAQSYTGGGATLDLREALSAVNRIGGTSLWIAVGANIENAEGGNAGDTITGNALANALFGMSGGDTLYGGDASDSLYGGTGIVSPVDGNDALYGQAGSDYLYGNGGNDTIFGGIGVADSGDAADTIYGGGGSDAVYGNGGSDSLSGGGSSVDPNDAADTVYGGGGADTIYGNGGADSLFGGGSSVDPNDAADVIYGGVGADSILGNGGNDTISGNEDNDTMHAGTGNDTYVFGNSSGDDLILLFENAGAVAGDTIQLLANINGTGITLASDILSRISYGSNQAVIDLGGGHSITIDAITSGSLTAADFSIG